ncbi:hypothetical protein JTB14_034590 [Gonioctena quinquepunctata]|nr:hypothetical protein JTB14_034590 [Gonioctena quinquepunctata]
MAIPHTNNSLWKFVKKVEDKIDKKAPQEYFEYLKTEELEEAERTITIHNIAEIVGTAYAASFIINNIKDSFNKPGICPMNRNAFADEDFDASHVTDQPLMNVINITPNTANPPNEIRRTPNILLNGRENNLDT